MFNYFKIFLVSVCFLTINTSIAESDNPKNIEKIKQAIVTIQSRVPVSAYMSTGSWTGTGFIVDPENGLIMTNTHVVGRAAVGTYFVTFHNGQQAEAKAVYYDAYADFAVLKVNKSDFPDKIDSIKFAENPSIIGEEIFIVGNTEGQGFSFHTGYLSDLYEINGEMPQGSFVINMNTTGGASGSPILNKDNKAIGILYGGGKTHALALKQQYLEHALIALQKDALPIRQHIGVITRLYSLDKAVKHRSFPKDEMKSYIKKNPNSRNRAIIVRNILPNSTAENILQSGDIIWSINGKEVAADLSMFDQTMNLAKGKAKLEIYRDGKKITKEIKLYDLNDRKVTRMFDFAGALFFEADDYISSISGIPLGSVTAVSVQTGSSFSAIKEMFSHNYKNIYRLVVEKIASHDIKKLDDVINHAVSIAKEKHVSIVYRNFQPYRPEFAGDTTFLSSHEKLVEDITFDSIDTNPRILKFNQAENHWMSEEVSEN